MNRQGTTAIQSFYGRWAGLYDLIATRTPGIRGVRERAVDALALEPGDSVVEMGCGTGANLPFLRRRVGPSGRVVGVDLTPGVLARASSLVDRRGWENVHVVLGDAARPPTTPVDAVLATFVVGMLDEPGVTVERWCDLLEPGGRIALLDAAPRSGRSGALDLAFRAFVALSAPPTRRVRYDESPAQLLGERVETARVAIGERGDVVVDDRFGRDLLRLTGVQIR